jgi:serralysin
MTLINEQFGTSASNTIDGTNEADIIIGLSGNDTINSGSGDDVVYGDFTSPNLLTGTKGASSFAQYSEIGAWAVNQEADGNTYMT